MQEMTMSEFNTRRKLLEEKFFSEFDESLINEIHKDRETKHSLDDLKAAIGYYDNDSLVEHLHSIGLSPSSLAAIKFVPLIQVAWADDSIEEGERVAILSFANDKGVNPGSICYKILKSWLHTKPSNLVWDTWLEYIKELKSHPELSNTIHELHQETILLAKEVASSSGGLLGFASVSDVEKKVLDRIANVFA